LVTFPLVLDEEKPFDQCCRFFRMDAFAGASIRRSAPERVVASHHTNATESIDAKN